MDSSVNKHCPFDSQLLMDEKNGFFSLFMKGKRLKPRYRVLLSMRHCLREDVRQVTCSKTLRGEEFSVGDLQRQISDLSPSPANFFISCSFREHFAESVASPGNPGSTTDFVLQLTTDSETGRQEI